ncbi:MAG: transposase, partial [Gaiellaceae bacterium]
MRKWAIRFAVLRADSLRSWPHPRPGVDYPESWRELLAWFPDDASCLTYLERLRWPAGFACPVCGGVESWRLGDGLLRCVGCD